MREMHKQSNQKIQNQSSHRRKDINLSSSLQEMGVKSAVNKLTMRIWHVVGKEDV